MNKGNDMQRPVKTKGDVRKKTSISFLKSWRSFSPIIVCILAHCMLPF